MKILFRKVMVYLNSQAIKKYRIFLTIYTSKKFQIKIQVIKKRQQLLSLKNYNNNIIKKESLNLKSYYFADNIIKTKVILHKNILSNKDKKLSIPLKKML